MADPVRPAGGETPARRGPKPKWLRVPLTTGPVYNRVRGLLRRLELHTV